MQSINDENADALGDQIARELADVMPIRAAQHLLKGIRDNATVHGIVREWLERCEQRKELRRDGAG